MNVLRVLTDTVGQVEVRGGFVEQNERRVLRQGFGYNAALFFAVAHFVDTIVCFVPQIDLFQRRFYNVAVVLAEITVPACVWESSCGHQIVQRQIFDHNVVGQHQSEQGGACGVR